MFCLNFQWLFDDGSERPDNCASWHPCHTNECYIECSAILRILLRCSCYSHTRYSAIFCTMTVVSSFLKWRLVLFLIFQLEVSFIRKFFKRLIKWSEKYCCASYQGLILWFWESSEAMKDFSGFLKLPSEIFVLAAPRSDFSCCWVLSGGFHRLDKVGIIFLLYGNVRTRKCVSVVYIFATLKHIKYLYLPMIDLRHHMIKYSPPQTGNHLVIFHELFFFFLIWMYTLLFTYITCNINITDKNNLYFQKLNYYLQ